MSQPILESVAKALIINAKGDVLVLTSSENKLRPWKSHNPDLPGGAVDPGETEHEAVVREIREETGIVIDQSLAIPIYSKTKFYTEENTSVTKHLFIVPLANNPDVKLSWEHESYAWVPLESLQNIELRSFYDDAIEYCLANKILPSSS